MELFKLDTSRAKPGQHRKSGLSKQVSPTFFKATSNQLGVYSGITPRCKIALFNAWVVLPFPQHPQSNSPFASILHWWTCFATADPAPELLTINNTNILDFRKLSKWDHSVLWPRTKIIIITKQVASFCHLPRAKG